MFVLRLLVMVLATLGLLLAGGCDNSDNGGGNGFGQGVPHDDDDTNPPDVPDPYDRGAYVEFSRTNGFGETIAVANVTSAWYNATPTRVRIPIPDDQDSCWDGSNPAGLYSIPTTHHDIGIPSITLLDGSPLEMVLDPALGVWTTDTATDTWSSNQEYDIAVSGGEDRAAASFPGVLGTPAALQLLDFDHATEGLYLEWYGGNNNGHVELRILQLSLPEGATEELATWVACRLLDDGQHLIPWETLANQNDSSAELELLRGASTNFTLDADTQGKALGASIVTHTYVPPTLGDDDDSSH